MGETNRKEVVEVIKMTNELNGGNIEKIKNETDICKGICDLDRSDECEKCVKTI